MKELWLKWQEWWANLAPREKKAVSIGGFFVALFILYYGIWSPYLNYIASMRQKIQSQQKTLAWMQSADKTMRAIQGDINEKNKTVSPGMFLSQIQKQINHSGIEQFLKQMKQASNGSIEMHFDKIEFDKLIHFFTTAIQENHIVISQLSLTATDMPGYVKADVAVKS